MARSRIRGLYAITPEKADTGELLAKVRLALAGGTRLVQYRSKLADRSLRFAQARQLLALCRSASATLIVNDDIECALEVGADGAHIGREDGEPFAARSRLGPGMLLGVSCYERLELALAAEAAGADYVAFGSVFASPTKPGAVRAGLALFSQARTRVQVPIVAIGGITAENAASVVAAGADALAVLSAVFEAADIEAAAAAFSTFFSPKRP
ncbi:MAG: thiamine phosphate synthase [Betaproteobacteria bacterium]|nr:thiamine phosphate synthase [Betaproteobacteria bacterium]MBI2961215.1 thiamine phosphate synthase [Betaproteobacteria bacterium]